MRAISRRIDRLENGLGLVQTGEERRRREQLERLGHPEPDRDRLREDMSGLTLAAVILRGRQRMQLRDRAREERDL